MSLELPFSSLHSGHDGYSRVHCFSRAGEFFQCDCLFWQFSRRWSEGSIDCLIPLDGPRSRRSYELGGGDPTESSMDWNV
ncbi:hypothetical protein CBR_g38021 [Chara braunii]|uniref:Uncharacterized protein n=1 Tax=Chara braunii TaxID=69332 RepID=A0A388K034_CHABU|nr:hypothetical protein CBR_g38021 [Chara braunii]|eukprot:GBG63398.1 hypothetical protein CBR_g38021 [Chara braunii]